MKVWLGTRDGGALVEPGRATVSVLDHGFTVGDGVFETLKVTPAGPFALTRHLRRLARSAATLGLVAPDEQIVRSAVADVVRSLGVDEPDRLWRLRITYSGGPAPLGSERDDVVPTLVVALAPGRPWCATTTAVTVPWTRNERSPLAGVKSTSYAENVVALARAHEAGASEALLANTRDELCEGTGSNVFVVVGGRVLTPALGSGALAGVGAAIKLWPALLWPAQQPGLRDWAAGLVERPLIVDGRNCLDPQAWRAAGCCAAACWRAISI